MKYIVGEQASRRAYATRNIDFMLKFAPLFLSHAFKIKPFSAVALGLPVGYFEKARELISSIYLLFPEMNNEPDRVHVLPQGIGIYYDYIHNQIKRKLLNCVVVDIGFNTVDIIVIEKGKARKEPSGRIEGKGVCMITNEIINTISRSYKNTVSEMEAKDILNHKQYKHYGVVEDLTPLIKNVSNEYARYILADIFNHWDESIRRTDKILLSGGGAYFLKDHIPEKYLQLVDIVRPDQPEFSNAAGFHKYLELKYGSN